MDASYNYYRSQVARILNDSSDDPTLYDYKIKITSDRGETKWFSLNRDQLLRITDILAEDES